MKLVWFVLLCPALAYGYDPVGNMSSNDSEYDNANRILVDKNCLYSHDANGNMTQRIRIADQVMTLYYYNSENKLVLANYQGTVMVEFKYDAFGRRIEKTINRSGIKTTRYYIYDGDNILAILDATNKPIAVFTHGSGIDQPLMMTTPSNGKAFYLHADGLGSIVSVTDENGQLIERIEYSAFGIPYYLDMRQNPPTVSDKSITENPFAFTGREWDPEIQLYYYRARYYDPYMGRFIQEDPAGAHPNYVYADNNPITKSDPYGLGPNLIERTTIKPIDWNQIRPVIGLTWIDFVLHDAKHYIWYPYHDFIQKPSWSFEFVMGSKMAFYNTLTPAFPMVLCPAVRDEFNKRRKRID